MLHTSSTTSSLGRGSWAAAAHTVSVQTIAAAGLSSGSSRCRSKTVTRASWVSRSSPSSESKCRRLPVAKGRSRWAMSPPLFCSREVVKIAEAGAVPALGVVSRQGVVQGGTALGAEPLPHHHLDETSQAADALQQLFRVAPVDDEGVHALARNSWGQDPPTGGPRHVGVLALGVDDVGPDAPTHPAQHSQLGGEGLAAAGTGQDGGVGVQVGAVEGVVDDGGAGPEVDAVEGAAPGVQVRRREGEQPRQ